MMVWTLNSMVLCTERATGKNRSKSSFRSFTQALSADVCSSVPCEALLWAELLLVHYGWGPILRGRGCCVLILWGEGDDTRLLPNPLLRFVHYLMGSDMQPQLVFWHRPGTCLKCAHQEEGREKPTGWDASETNEVFTRQHFSQTVFSTD